MFSFNDAILAHRNWRTKLADYLPKADGSLSPAEIQRDDLCQLGQWLHGEGSKFSMLPEFAHLMKSHLSFHRAAADVVRRANEGHGVQADAAIGPNSTFAKCSAEVVVAIAKLRDHD